MLRVAEGVEDGRVRDGPMRVEDEGPVRSGRRPGAAARWDAGELGCCSPSRLSKFLELGFINRHELLVKSPLTYQRIRIYKHALLGRNHILNNI